MVDRKLFVSAAVLAAALAFSACSQRSADTAGPNAETVIASAAHQGSPPTGHWAFPGPHLKAVPNSAAKYSDVQMFDRTNAVDWFPDAHPAMPPAVKGALPVYACGFCHLPEGAGRSENAALAGLPAEYIIQQVKDMKAGLRKPSDPKFGPAVNMQLTIEQVDDAAIAEAAAYYASLKYTKRLKLVESADVPHHLTNSFVYVFDDAGPREPLGDRIIEGPDDFGRFEMRDPNMTFTAYVPIGSTARGAELAKGDGGAKPACETCHGAGLKGGPIGPPIAGRLPTSAFRQLRAFQNGGRNGPGAAMMKPVLEGLPEKDLLALSVYVASLEP